MKKILLVASFVLLSIKSQAQSHLNNLVDQIIDQARVSNLSADKLSFSLSDPLPKGVTKIKMKVKVVKTSVTKNGDKFETKSEEVCQTLADTYAVDARQMPKGGFPKLPDFTVKCPSTLAGKATTVYVSGVVVIGNSKIFDDEASVDLKEAGAWMDYGDLNPERSKNQSSHSGSSFFISRDINLVSQIFAIIPHVKYCSEPTCEPTPEYFTAVVELIDDVKR